VGFVVASVVKSQDFYQGLGFEAEGEPKKESGPMISQLVGIEGVLIKTLKMQLRRSAEGLWREGGFRLELIEYLVPVGLTVVQESNNVIAKGHMCFTVEDVGAVVKRILELGGSSPFEAVLDDAGNPTMTYVLDPDGIPIELNVQVH
jgi:catechol 2,3-dioxygenase-like lactoylglutathione lyase family enzyme